MPPLLWKKSFKSPPPPNASDPAPPTELNDHPAGQRIDLTLIPGGCGHHRVVPRHRVDAAGDLEQRRVAEREDMDRGNGAGCERSLVAVKGKIRAVDHILVVCGGNRELRRRCTAYNRAGGAHLNDRVAILEIKSSRGQHIERDRRHRREDRRRRAAHYAVRDRDLEGGLGRVGAVVDENNVSCFEIGLGETGDRMSRIGRQSDVTVCRV